MVSIIRLEHIIKSKNKHIAYPQYKSTELPILLILGENMKPHIYLIFVPNF